MSYQENKGEDRKTKTLEANMVNVSLHAQARGAFREWLDASRAWSTLRLDIEANGYSSTSRRELEELEKRLNTAADALRQAQQRLSDFPPRAAVARRGQPGPVTRN